MDQKEYSDITIVVVAYNRPLSLERLLSSINNASYPNINIRLIISIDKGDNQNVLDVANNFRWRYGEKIVNYQPMNLGLREHILKCGDLTNQYGNVIILEDDLYVSENYFNYTLEAIKYYKNTIKITGISLYNHQYNETSKLPFSPLNSNFDVYFMQLPSSWGQAWTRGQWERFRKWYDNHKQKGISPKNYLPQNITKWPESSWKKYFTKYIVENDLYFVYPYLSLSTNFGDIGQHFWSQSSCFQAPLCNFMKKDYKFCDIKESAAIYDAFCENVTIKEYFPELKDEMEIDLYGSKNLSDKKYLLTPKVYPYKIIDSFALSMKPIEENVIKKIQGNYIYLYDKSIVLKQKKIKKVEVDLINFFYSGLDIKKSLFTLFSSSNIEYIRKGIIKKITQKIKKKRS